MHIFKTINYVREALLPHVFFEVGCHSGRTFSATINVANLSQLDLTAVAFDSFQGLPNTKINDNQIIKGFYNESLNDDLKGKLPRHVGMVHIDVDLYSSTCSALEFIKDYIVEGAVILFDDWHFFPPGEEKGIE